MHVTRVISKNQQIYFQYRSYRDHIDIIGSPCTDTRLVALLGWLISLIYRHLCWTLAWCLDQNWLSLPKALFLACRERQASIVLERYFRFEIFLLSILCMLIARMKMGTSRVSECIRIFTTWQAIPFKRKSFFFNAQMSTIFNYRVWSPFLVHSMQGVVRAWIHVFCTQTPILAFKNCDFNHETGKQSDIKIN